MDSPRIVYLLTAEISKVLVEGQLDAVHAAGFEVVVGVGLASGSSTDPGAGWDESATIHHIPFRRQPAPLADLQALRATVRLLRETQPDIVNASTPKAGLLGMAAARWCRVPVRVYHLRGLRFESMTGWRRRLLILLERCAAGMASHVIVNSSSAQAAAMAAGIGRRRHPVLIGAGSGNGIDVQRYARSSHPGRSATRSALGLPADALVLGFIGRLTRDKGVGDLLEVFDELTDERPDLHLLLVGDIEPGDPVGPEAERRIRSRSDITHLPWVAETADIYPALDLVVFPSRREGLPNVPLQAQCASVPVVAYAATGTVDAVGDDVSGVLVEPGDRPGLADAVRSLLDDHSRRIALGAAGPSWVRERFEQRTFWAELVTTYRSWMTADA